MISENDGRVVQEREVLILEWAVTVSMCGGRVSCEAKPIWNTKESLW